MYDVTEVWMWVNSERLGIFESVLSERFFVQFQKRVSKKRSMDIERKLAVVQVNFYLVNLKIWWLPCRVWHSELIITDDSGSYFYESGPDNIHCGWEATGLSWIKTLDTNNAKYTWEFSDIFTHWSIFWHFCTPETKKSRIFKNFTYNQGLYQGF